MGKEIEIKFLIREDGINYFTEAFSNIFQLDKNDKYSVLKKANSWVIGNGDVVTQGYISVNSAKNIISNYGIRPDFHIKEARLREVYGKDMKSRYYFTLKSDGSMTRNEIEREISYDIFKQYLVELSEKRIDKFRCCANFQGLRGEFDVYMGRDLFVVEFEAPSIEILNRITPLGNDVTNDPKYKNRNLARDETHRSSHFWNKR